jgi:SET domain-containing protein
LNNNKRMSPRPFRLGRALTGLGLFATRPIKKRTRLAEYKGPLLDAKAAEKAENSGNRYLFEVNSRWTIDGKSRKNVARYFNHSCNPNCDSTIRGKRVFIYTIRAIKPGEELTYDYGIDYLKNVIGKSNCKCSRCRRRRAKRARELRKGHKRREALSRRRPAAKAPPKAAARRPRRSVRG